MSDNYKENNKMNEQTIHSFTAALKIVLEENGGPQQLCKVLGIAVSQISRYTTGRQMPNIHTLIAISNWANVSIDWLLTMSGKKNAETIFTKRKSNSLVELAVYKNPWIMNNQIVGELAPSLFYSEKALSEFVVDSSQLIALVLDERMIDEKGTLGNIVVVQINSTGVFEESGLHIIDIKNVPKVRIVNKTSNTTIIKSNMNKVHVELTQEQLEHVAPIKPFGRIVHIDRFD